VAHSSLSVESVKPMAYLKKEELEELGVCEWTM